MSGQPFVYHKAAVRKGAAKGGARAAPAPRTKAEEARAMEVVALPPVRDYLAELRAKGIEV